MSPVQTDKVKEDQVWDPCVKGRQGREQVPWTGCVVARGEKRGQRVMRERYGWEELHTCLAAQDKVPSSEQLLSKSWPNE